jgi:hypothetical protein
MVDGDPYLVSSRVALARTLQSTRTLGAMGAGVRWEGPRGESHPLHEIMISDEY